MKMREIAVALRNVVLGANVESLLAMKEPRKAASYIWESRFLYKCIFPNGGLTQKPVWEVFEADRVPVVLYAGGAREWFRPAASYGVDLISMCALCQILRPSTIFEIGTYRGAGALHWAGNAPDAEVYTLDLPVAATPILAVTSMDQHIASDHAQMESMLFDRTPEARRIHCLYGDSATFDFSPFSGKVDLFLVDGAHSYEYVRNDTLRAIECCKPGGLIAWHDYGRAGFNGVSKWLHEFSRQQGKTIYRVPGGSLAYTEV